jgi:hypothetical protein
MTPLQGVTAAASAIMLFLSGLQGFSNELQAVGEETLRTCTPTEDRQSMLP